MVALNIDNLIPMDQRSENEVRELGRKGGIASGKARQENATMRKRLQTLLNSKTENGKEYADLVELGLIANAIDKNKGGNPRAYELIARMLGELEQEERPNTPEININIVDNSNLEKVMYEEKE